ncbi:MAG: arginine--tRNA ligase [Candidatus Aminicenantes bacterium]|nr:arginine--tRNA ligase [Candidatus Aminicenantes bacterium]
MITFKEKLRKKIASRLRSKGSFFLDDLELNYTPQMKMGDMALTFPFQIAKQTGRSPRDIAVEYLPLLKNIEGVDKIEVAGAGFINLHLNRKTFFEGRFTASRCRSYFAEENKIIIEHTNINPNKAAHIGHLRNACLGDTLSRCLKDKGENVEVQNYIDDTGVQVVDVVLGFKDLEKKDLSDIEKYSGRFDYYCWDLYVRVSSLLGANPHYQKRRSEILKKIEHNIDPEASMARLITMRNVKAHLNTMNRLDIHYDLLPFESSILGLKFWEKAFALLKKKKAIFFVEEGPHKGCWVMPFEEDKEKEKIIVRSDGTVTYVGKDIAYQLWKFGLLERDFNYSLFPGSDSLWVTSIHPGSSHPSFGKSDKVYNVIDTRQSYLQKIVVQGLKALGFFPQAEKSIHFSYEMVALSPKSLKEIGQKISGEKKEKTFHEVSGRKGLGIKADDLMDSLEEKALSEIEKRNPDLEPLQKKEIARKIACGALRYFMLKFARNSLIIFDFDEALSFEGETGPYLQYTMVRLKSIFRKWENQGGLSEPDILASADLKNIPWDSLTDKEKDDLWDLIFYAAQLEEEVLHSIRSLEFSHLAKFTFNLCQKLNAYYHLYPVITESEKNVRSVRLLALIHLKNVISRALNLMGIPHPDRM